MSLKPVEVLEDNALRYMLRRNPELLASDKEARVVCDIVSNNLEWFWSEYVTLRHKGDTVGALKAILSTERPQLIETRGR